MRRRAVLAGALAAATGCPRGPADDGGLPGVSRSVSIGTVDAGALPANDLKPGVSVGDVFGEEEAGHASVDLSLRNDGDPVTLGVERCPPADHLVGRREEGDARVLLLSVDGWDADPDPAAPTPSGGGRCWRPRARDFSVGAPCTRADVDLATGEEWVRAFEVWDHPDNGDCLPPGNYRFRETLDVGGTALDWTVTLLVEAV